MSGLWKAMAALFFNTEEVSCRLQWISTVRTPVQMHMAGVCLAVNTGSELC